MTQRWNARERVCGRMIEVDFDPKSGKIEAPARCPECGISPVYVDLAERIAKPTSSAPPATSPGPGAVATAGHDSPAPKVTQAAADLAASNGIELASVKATGAGGTIITKADVEAAISAGKEGES